MATTKKKTAKKGADASKAGYPRDHGNGNLNGVKSDDGYYRLRTILDSLEIGAIRFYLQRKDAKEREARLQHLESVILPVAQSMWGGPGRVIDCPRGYVNCDGVCVPYSC